MFSRNRKMYVPCGYLSSTANMCCTLQDTLIVAGIVGKREWSVILKYVDPSTIWRNAEWDELIKISQRKLNHTDELSFNEMMEAKAVLSLTALGMNSVNEIDLRGEVD